MSPLLRVFFFVAFVKLTWAATFLGPVADIRGAVTNLKQRLSPEASISFNASSDPRWSQFNAPSPRAIVNVATERDVVVTVKFCKAKKIPFLAQNGGCGWISSFDLSSRGVIINLHGLNQVTFNPDKTQATIGGGTLISEAIGAAYANNAQITTGNCNCVGVLGAILGGGYGNLMGLNGFGVDTLISLNYVNPHGDLVTITPRDTDLWWALRGAGPNFGIVTYAVVGSKAVMQADNTAWLGSVIFTEDKLESVVTAINNLKLEPEMNVFLYYAVSMGKPVVLITPFYYGSEATARQKFATLLGLGPVADTTAITSYPHWNDGAAGFCIRGGRKPAYAAGMLHLKPAVWRAVWNEFVKFTSNPGTDQSVVLMEAYSLGKGRSVGDSSSSFPYRQVTFNAAVLPWYYDAGLDPVAEAYGKRVRDLWWSNSDLATNVSYINFAHGDEELGAVYGQGLQHLQSLKAKYDPSNIFNQCKLRCQTLHTLAERKRLSSGNSSNIWRTPSNSSAYWDLYLATRPPYTSSFFEHMYTYHSRHSESFQIALDVGTGCGQAVPKLAQRFPHVIATDNNEEHIIEARRRLAHLQAPTKVQFAVCKAEDLASPSSSLALEPSSVDFIAAAECMPLLDTDVAISTFAHLLRPGGTLAMWFYGRPRFAEVEFVQTCQPLFDQILDRTFRMTVSGGGVEHQQAWKKALQGMRSWLDDVALPVGQWQDVSRHKWNTHAELPFFGDEALDFEAPGPLSRVSKVEKVTEERDDEFWGLEWSPRGVRDFVEACFPGLKERQAKDDVLQDLLRKIEEAMGGVNAVRKFTWPAVLVLAARRRKK